MRVTFYDTRVDENKRVYLVKEKGVMCDIPCCSNPQYVAEMLNKTCELDKLAEESCYLLALSSKCKVIGAFHLSKGTVSQTIVSTREVFMKALLVGAASIIISHNHPSGDCTPSKEDIEIAKKIKAAGELMRVPLIDSIIVGMDSGYLSFQEQGLL